MISLDTSTLWATLKEAKKFETQRDFENELKSLSLFWDDVQFNPDTEGLPPETEAEILRLCGNWLVQTGRAKAIEGFQERGKNYLTKATDIFQYKTKLYEQAAIAKCQLAWSYSVQGRDESANFFLMDAAENCKNKKCPTYARIRINQITSLIRQNKIEDAASLMRHLEPLIASHPDQFIRIMYYHQCGQLYSVKDDYSTGLAFFEIALKLSKDIKNKRIEGQSLNGLAYTYFQLNDHENALKYIEKAISIACDCDDLGWLADYYETKAKILIGEKKYTEALLTINQSLKHLERASDSVSLCISLWTKIKLLQLLNRPKEACEVYAVLFCTALEAFGEKSASEYTTKFLRLTPNSNAAQTVRQETLLIKDSDIIQKIHRGNLKIFNMPRFEKFELFYIPSDFSDLLGVEHASIVLSAWMPPGNRSNPLMLTHKRTNQIFIGNYETECLDSPTIFNSPKIELNVLKVSKDEYDIPANIESDDVYYSGSIVCVADAKDIENGFIEFRSLAA